VHETDREVFREGYIAGWRSIRGDDPMMVPPSPVIVGTPMHLVGFSRGARDAGATTDCCDEST
jgi:hypothetical protein